MDAESTATQREIITSIAFYSLCSSLMLVVNKMAMALVPVAALVNMMQLVSCTVFVTAISHAGLVPVSAATGFGCSSCDYIDYFAYFTLSA